MANEQRLIDANALMEDFRQYMVERYDREKCVSGENCKTCENSCLWRKIVSRAPTVDAVEVVHGRWEPVDHDGSWRVDMCSICHRRMHYVDYDQPYQYCPNCGADMRERKDNV